MMTRFFLARPLAVLLTLLCICLSPGFCGYAGAQDGTQEGKNAAAVQELEQEELPLLDDFLDRFAIENEELTVGLPKFNDELTSVEGQDPVELLAKRISLGQKLFFDPILSKDNSVSCASCHRPDKAFALNKASSVGLSRRNGRRNVPSLLNRRFGGAQFWDGRAKSLEDQALQPIESPEELGHSIDGVLKSLNTSAEYQALFKDAFADGINKENLAIAIVTFEKTLVSGNSAIDRFQSSLDSLSDQQRHGLWLYESKAGCWKCHSNATYTDEKFHNTGVSWGEEPLDLGLYEISENETDRGKFKTPPLRDVALTAPYMHDGSIKTLREVVKFYSEGGTDNPHKDSKLKVLNLSEREIDSLVVFLESLTGDHPWHDQAAKSNEAQDKSETDQESDSKPENSTVESDG